MSTQFSGRQEHYPSRSVTTEVFARVLSNLKEATDSASAALADDVIELSPIDVPFRCTIDRLGYSTGGVVAGNVRLGLYTGVLGYPDLPDGEALVVESGSVAQLNINRLHWLTVVDTQIDPGRYFIGIQSDDAVATAWRITRSDRYDHNVDGTVSPGRFINQAYGAFPNPCPVTGANVFKEVIFFIRVESLP